MKYKQHNIVANINVNEYINNYRDVGKFIGFCKQCNCYNACWACPPFNFDTSKCMLQYEKAHIIGTKIILDSTLIDECTGLQKCKDTAYRIIGEVRCHIDNKLLELERRYENCRAFFAGTCHICKQGECTRIVGKSCLYPDKLRPSLEAFGFDIAKTASQLLNTDLKWSSEGRLPEYFMLVSGLFTNREIEHIVW
jgi:predicted metal-binding protein